MRIRVFLCVTVCMLVAGVASGTIYVNKAATGSNNGTSWANAYTSLQPAIDAAAISGGAEVWVAAGTYGENRTEGWGNDGAIGSLVLKDNVRLYGGFSGTETAKSQRAVRRNETIISGATSRAGSPAYHVIAIGNATSAILGAELDGFTISSGNALGFSGYYHTYRGGGMYVWNSSPLVANCTFISNSAEVSGGAVSVDRSTGSVTPQFVNCVFFSNVARRQADAGYTGAPNPFRGGGAVFANNGTQPSFNFCTFYGNEIQNLSWYLPGDETIVYPPNTEAGKISWGLGSGAIYAVYLNTTISVLGSILWADLGGSSPDEIVVGEEGTGHNPSVASVTDSDVEGGYIGTNISSDPVFAFPLGPEFQLQDTSPCIDKLSTGTVLRDLPGMPRYIAKSATRWDMGAYEYAPIGVAAVCGATTLTLSGSTATLDPAAIDGGSTSEAGRVINQTAGIWKRVASKTTFDCTNIGPNTVSLTVYDYLGHSATCANATVTVQEMTAPVANCKAITVNLSGTNPGTVSILPADVNSGSTDNCGTVTLVSVTPSSFTCANVGANMVTLLVRDPSGNTATCETTVTVRDITAPTAACKAYTANLDASGNITVAAASIFDAAGSSDNCTVNVAGSSPSPLAYTCANIGPNTATLIVNDGNGNTATCTSTITVRDVTPPASLTTKATTVNLDASGNATVTAAAVYNSATDNCGTVTPQSVSPASFTCTDIGNKTVTLTVNDGNGNTSTATATVTVRDLLAPTVTTKNITVNLTGPSATVLPADVVQSGSDNCGTVNYTGVTPNSFACAQTGANTVTLSYNDGKGNAGTATATVTVVENTPPTAVCKAATVTLDAAGSGTLLPADVNNGSTDVCGAATPTAVTPNTFNCTKVGPNTVTLTVSDPSGNTATCTTTVTVRDTTAPTVPANGITRTLGGGGYTLVAADITALSAGATDACGINAAQTTVSPTSFACGSVASNPNPVTVTVVDNNGNTGTATGTVTVQESTPPTALCNPITVSLDGTGSYTFSYVSHQADILALIAGSDDNCGLMPQNTTVSPATLTCANLGPNTVTVTVYDGSGLTAQCTTTVTASGGLRVSNPTPAAVEKYRGDNVSWTVDGCGGTGTVSGYTFTWEWGTTTTGPWTAIPNGAFNGSTATITTLSGGAQSQLSLATLQTVLTGYIHCSLRDAGGMTVTSNATQLTVRGPVSVDSIAETAPLPANLHANTGQTYSMQATVTGGYPDPNYTYVWQFGGSPIVNGPHPSGSGSTVSGAATATLTITNVKVLDTGSYTCIARDKYYVSAPSNSQGSLAVSVLITDKLAAGNPTPSPQNKYTGGSSTFTCTPTGGKTPYTYQWQWSPDGGITPWANLTTGDRGGRVTITDSAGNSQIAIATLVDGMDDGSYQCLVDDASPDAQAAPTTPGVLNVYDHLSIVTPPANYMGNEGDLVTYNIVIAGGIPTVTYAWQYNSGSGWVPLSNGPRGTSTISGATTDTLHIANANVASNAGSYRCVVSDGNSTPETQTSAAATITLGTQMSISLPGPRYVYTGEALVLTTTVTNGVAPYTFQWYEDGAVSGAPITQPGNSVSLTLTPADPATHNNKTYSCSVTDSTSTSDTSPDCLVLVRDPIQITAQPQNYWAYVGQNASFSMTFTGGYPPYTYQWRLNGTTVSNSASYSIPAVVIGQNNGAVDVIVRDAGSNSADPLVRVPDSETSSAATLHVASPISVSVPPQNNIRLYTGIAPTTGDADANYTMTATFTGGFGASSGVPGGATFVWKRVKVSSPGAGTIQTLGATGNYEPGVAVTRTIQPNTETANVGVWDYYVEVVERSTTTKSANGRVELGRHVYFPATDPLLDTTANGGSNVTLSVTAQGGFTTTGFGNSFQWSFQQEGTTGFEVIGGATASSLFLSKVSGDDDTGTYRVEVTDALSTLGNSLTIFDDGYLTVSGSVPAAGLSGLAVLALSSMTAGMAALRRRRK